MGERRSSGRGGVVTQVRGCFMIYDRLEDISLSRGCAEPRQSRGRRLSGREGIGGKGGFGERYATSQKKKKTIQVKIVVHLEIKQSINP